MIVRGEAVFLEGMGGGERDKGPLYLLDLSEVILSQVWWGPSERE